jgi:hypothetical protein
VLLAHEFDWELIKNMPLREVETSDDCILEINGKDVLFFITIQKVRPEEYSIFPLLWMDGTKDTRKLHSHTTVAYSPYNFPHTQSLNNATEFENVLSAYVKDGKLRLVMNVALG